MSKNTRKLSDFERSLRMNVRNFLLTATLPQLTRELEISQERGDRLRAEFVKELIEEYESE